MKHNLQVKRLTPFKVSTLRNLVYSSYMQGTFCWEEGGALFLVDGRDGEQQV